MTRGRKPLITKSRDLHIHLDGELGKLVDERLWSDAEQRIPKGAHQAFITEAIVRMLRQIPVDLAPYVEGTMPTEHVVYVFAPSKEVLQEILERREG